MPQIILVFLLAALFLQVAYSPKIQMADSEGLPVDPQATQETRNLYVNMKRLWRTNANPVRRQEIHHKPQSKDVGGRKAVS